jgi:hypothetical protein
MGRIGEEILINVNDVALFLAVVFQYHLPNPKQSDAKKKDRNIFTRFLMT